MRVRVAGWEELVETPLRTSFIDGRRMSSRVETGGFGGEKIPEKDRAGLFSSLSAEEKGRDGKLGCRAGDCASIGGLNGRMGL